MTDAEYEHYLIEHIEALRKKYEQAAEPYFKKLAELQAMREKEPQSAAEQACDLERQRPG